MRKISFLSLKVKYAFERTDRHKTHTQYSDVLSGHLYQISPKWDKKCGQYTGSVLITEPIFAELTLGRKSPPSQELLHRVSRNPDPKRGC